MDTSIRVTPWYEVDNIDAIDTPALMVYPERVRQNIRTLVSMVKDPSLLRPHAKTHKSSEAACMMIEEGIRKFKCATIAEAEMLARAGADDVLIAYQPVGPKIARLHELIVKYPATRFSCLIDNAGTARSIASFFHAHGGSVFVYVDLNVGMNRTGIAPENALHLFHAVKDLEGIALAGLHVYDGHIQQTDLEERRRAFESAFAPVERLASDIRKEQGDTHFTIVAGGSPTFPFYAARGDVECSPGTFVYWDKAYETLLAEQPFLPAMVIATRVVSHPAQGTICIDAGYKAVSCEKDLAHRLFFPGLPDARLVSQSEEHAVIATERAAELQEGDVLYAIPYHICPTCAMYERARTVMDHHAEGEWRMIARDRMISV